MAALKGLLSVVESSRRTVACGDPQGSVLY